VVYPPLKSYLYFISNHPTCYFSEYTNSVDLSFPGSNSACSLNNQSLGSRYCGTYLGMTSAMGTTSAISLSICGDLFTLILYLFNVSLPVAVMLVVAVDVVVVVVPVPAVAVVVVPVVVVSAAVVVLLLLLLSLMQLLLLLLLLLLLFVSDLYKLNAREH